MATFLDPEDIALAECRARLDALIIEVETPPAPDPVIKTAKITPDPTPVVDVAPAPNPVDNSFDPFSGSDTLGSQG